MSQNLTSGSVNNVIRSFVSVAEFAEQHGLHRQGYNGILVLKSSRDWLVVFPNGEAYWNGQIMAQSMPARIEGDRLLMPEAELEQAFGVNDTQPPELLLGKAPTGLDLFVVGGAEFPLHTKKRDEYVAHPINRLYGGDVFHREGQLFTPAARPTDLRPKVVLQVAQQELAGLARDVTFGRAQILIFRNKSWAIFGLMNGKDDKKQVFTADYIAMLRVKGDHFQLKPGVAFR